jgi:hypothetical protein
VEVEQLKADRNKMSKEREEKVRWLISQIGEPHEETHLDERYIERKRRLDGTEDIRFLLTPRRPED